MVAPLNIPEPYAVQAAAMLDFETLEACQVANEYFW